MGKTSKKVNTRPHLTSTYKTKKVPVRVAYHKYTGKKLPFYCTSYALIFFLLSLTFFSVILSARLVAADQTGSGNIFLSGQVKGKPPEIAAQITSPKNGEKFTNTKILIEGTCLQDTYVEIYRGNRFLGMAACNSEGRYTMTITLWYGKNVLVAKIRDSLGQYGPNSTPIEVYYERPSGSNSNSTDGASKIDPDNQFELLIDPLQQSIWLGQALKISYTVKGDKPPYTLAFDWGDGTPSDLIKQDKPGTYTITHIYKQAGKNVLRISVLGSAGGNGTIQSVVIVHTNEALVSGTISCADNPTDAVFASICNPPVKQEVFITRFIGPAVGLASIMAFSFFIGEKLVFARMTHSYK